MDKRDVGLGFQNRAAHVITLLGFLIVLVTGALTVDDYSKGWAGFALGGLLSVLGLIGEVVDRA